MFRKHFGDVGVELTRSFGCRKETLKPLLELRGGHKRPGLLKAGHCPTTMESDGAHARFALPPGAGYYLPAALVSFHVSACRPGFYKAFAGNVKCSKCPPHSLTHVEATSVCQCEKGYFRAEKDPPTMACTRPPSAPRNVVFNINDTALMLEWSPPSDTGGRKDLTYSVICKKCGSDAKQCELCGGSLRFVPRHTGLVNSSVTVLDFVAHVNYTFEIEATNGVSELSFSPKQFTAITVITDQDGNQISVVTMSGTIKNCEPIISQYEFGNSGKESRELCKTVTWGHQAVGKVCRRFCSEKNLSKVPFKEEHQHNPEISPGG
ncbi:hypothetical protein WISP_30556 [Willisornis vidua]|uniref:Fibronectin type-III domain-containing protein n=1 Tax=Willisornis vidua TaxID=1566151 RepID=A0ABQ9DKY4_9PASS|nr:hypothetical protein WISP_30556 [Willisornis vidua]